MSSAELAPTIAHDLTARNVSTLLTSYAIFGERFSFWGLQAILVLMLTSVFSQPEYVAYAMIGAFGALSYAFSLLGGYLADKIFGVWQAVLVGLGLCLTGNFFLFLAPNLFFFKIGLAFVLAGAGFFSPSSNNLIRALYEHYPERKEHAFVLTTIAGNISGALGPLLYGLLGARDVWQYSFGLSAFFNLFAFSALVMNRQAFANQCVFLASAQKLKLYKITAGVSIILLSLLLVLHADWLTNILWMIAGPFTLAMTFFILQLNSAERKDTLFLILLTCILMFFYVFVFQIYSSVTSFVAHFVDRKLFNWTVPTAVYASLQCLFFILFAPIVNKIFAKPNQMNLVGWPLQKVIIGLSIAAGGFFVLGISEWIAHRNGVCSSGWIVLANSLLGLGEVFLYPPILTMIATFSPKRWAGVFMGGFSLSIAISSFMAGKLATCIAHARSLSSYASVVCEASYVKISFTILLVTAFVAIGFWVICPWLAQRRQVI